MQMIFLIKIWKKIFEMVEDLDWRKPLDFKTLSNPNSKFVKTIIYIYSMESFLFKEMNRATRDKDTDKIKFFGPFASALSLIIHSGNKNFSDLKKQFSVYRGL